MLNVIDCITDRLKKLQILIGNPDPGKDAQRRPLKGVPIQIAIDSEGLIYVADQRVVG